MWRYAKIGERGNDMSMGKFAYECFMYVTIQKKYIKLFCGFSLQDTFLP